MRRRDTPRRRWRRGEVRALGSCRSELRILIHQGRGRCYNLVLVCRRSSGHDGQHRGLCRPGFSELTELSAHGFVAVWP